MGQRLVITVKREDKELAKIYYHWSAYTLSAFMEAKHIIDNLDYVGKSDRDIILNLIRIVEENGGGIDGGVDGSEMKRVQEVFPNEKFKCDGINRSYGLIAISEDGMNDIQSLSEGDLDIHIGSETVSNYVYWSYELIEFYKEELKDREEEIDDEYFDNIIQFPIYPYEVEFDRLGEIIDFMKTNRQTCYLYGEEVYEIYE